MNYFALILWPLAKINTTEKWSEIDKANGTKNLSRYEKTKQTTTTKKTTKDW